MNKIVFDFLLKYTSWLRGHRTTVGLVLNFLTVLISIVAALVAGDYALFLTSSTSFVALLMVAVGLKPEPADQLPPNDNWDVLR